MEKTVKRSLSIAYLYPKLLNIYGDIGNITALKKRCSWRSIDVNIQAIDIGDTIDANKYDLFFIGGGQDNQQILVAQELKKNKDSLKLAAQSGCVFLGICGGYQLLGKYYQPVSNRRLEGIGLLDVYTIASEKRFISNVCVQCNLVTSKILVGFENHSGLTYIEKGTEPLGIVLTGNGNNGADKTEGARKNNVFGTYLHGAFLPKNPEFADYLISLALVRKYHEIIKLEKLDDSIEKKLQEQLAKKKF